MVRPNGHAKAKVAELLSTLTKVAGAAALAISLSAPLRAHAQEADDATAADVEQPVEFFSHGHQKHHGGGQSDQGQPDQGASQAPSRGGAVPAGQQQVADAQAQGKGLFFAEVKNVRVVRVLPDDTQGLKHQKWVVALDNGNELMAVYNTDICDRVPVRVGDTMSIGGQYIWDKGGGLLHWLHDDPRKSRPDGYVEVGGQRYGTITHPNR